MLISILISLVTLVHLWFCHGQIPSNRDWPVRNNCAVSFSCSLFWHFRNGHGRWYGDGKRQIRNAWRWNEPDGRLREPDRALHSHERTAVRRERKWHPERKWNWPKECFVMLLGTCSFSAVMGMWCRGFLFSSSDPWIQWTLSSTTLAMGERQERRTWISLRTTKRNKPWAKTVNPWVS